MLKRIFGAGRKKKRATLTNITVAAAHARVRDGDLLVDVREPAECNETGRPAGAKGIALGDPAFLEKFRTLTAGDTERPLMVSCKSGARSSKAAERLLAAGYTTVASVEGGFMAWLEAGLPVDEGPF